LAYPEDEVRTFLGNVSELLRGLHGLTSKVIILLNENVRLNITRMSREAVVAYFKVLLQHLNRDTEENCENIASG
jgi:hypothetical protein